MTGRTVTAAALVTLVVATACGNHEFEPPDTQARIDRAGAAYSSALFDTVSWSDEATQVTQGNAVYAAECRRCHGPLGQGGTDYARQRNLSVPSLVVADWPFATTDSLRHMIYTGHEGGMPVFGDGDLTLREIDATAAYILLTLRPDVLEQD